MKTRKIRLLSALLALAMLLALLPTAAFADDAPGGNCGKDGSDVKWKLVGDTLTISGTGEMEGFIHYYDRPWNSQISNIKKIVIENGITAIIGGAFWGCTELTEVDMSGALSLKTIGNHAFAECPKLEIVNLPQNGALQKIGEKVFSYTINASRVACIEKIIIPASVTTIGANAFDGCKKLTTVIFAKGSKLSYVHNDAFQGCSNVTIYCEDNVMSKLNRIVGADKIKPLTLTVTFISNGGSDVDAKPVENGKTISAPAAPTKEGYVFDGWYTDVALTQKYDFSKPVIDDMTLYAKWEEVPVDTYVVTVENGVAWVEADAETEAVAAGESICVPEGVTVHVKADETAFDGMAFERWEVRKGDVKLENDRAAETTFTMPAGEVQLEAMYQAAEVHDSGWDAATVVTGVAIGTGTAILAYHIGMEVYAEQVLGKDVAVPRTRAEVALLAWQLAGSPAVNGKGEPLSEAAQAEKWAVESGLMQKDAEGNFNGTKKMSKWNALRTLDAAKKMG